MLPKPDQPSAKGTSTVLEEIKGFGRPRSSWPCAKDTQTALEEIHPLYETAVAKKGS